MAEVNAVLDIGAGKYSIDSDFYLVTFEAGASAIFGALDFVVKQGENVNRITDPSSIQRRPFNQVLETANLSTHYGLQHELNLLENGPVRCVLNSTDGTFVPLTNAEPDFETFSADVQVVAWPDRFIVCCRWRNNASDPVVVKSNMHTWWYSNGFYARNRIVKNVQMKALYDGSAFEWASCAYRWNQFAGPPVVSDSFLSTWIAHWYRPAEDAVVTDADGDFVQVFANLVQPPGGASAAVISGKCEDYQVPCIPQILAGTLRTDTPGDNDTDGFNESESAYQVDCEQNRAALVLGVERTDSVSRDFYFPAIVLHGYNWQTAPVLRINGERVDNETGAPHSETAHIGQSYSSAVLPGGKAAVWCNAVFDQDVKLEAAPMFGTRRMLRFGGNLSGRP